MRISPYVVGTFLFMTSAFSVIRTYRLKAGTPAYDLAKDIEWLPHVLVQTLMFPIGILMSITAIVHYYDLKIDAIYSAWLLFGFTFLNFTIALIAMLSRSMRNLLKSGDALSGISRSWRTGNSSSVFYFVLGICVFYMAWCNDSSMVIFSFAVKSTIVMVLLTYTLERIGMISSSISNLDRLRECRQ